MLLGGVDKGASHPEPEVIQGCLLKRGAGAARFADGVRNGPSSSPSWSRPAPSAAARLVVTAGCWMPSSG